MSYDRKHYETLRARAALSEVTLVALQDDAGRDTFLATTGPLTQALDSLEDAEQWLGSVAPLECALEVAGGAR